MNKKVDLKSLNKVSTISNLVSDLIDKYGSEAVQDYATSIEEQDDVSFIIENINATFSVILTENDLLDIQIESRPPGDYIYTRIVSTNDFLSLIDIYKGPIDTWPRVK